MALLENISSLRIKGEIFETETDLPIKRYNHSIMHL